MFIMICKILFEIIFKNSASWIKRFTAGTAINDAINAGHHSSDCEQKYSGCKLKLRSFEDILETVLISLS